MWLGFVLSSCGGPQLKPEVGGDPEGPIVIHSRVQSETINPETLEPKPVDIPIDKAKSALVARRTRTAQSILKPYYCVPYEPVRIISGFHDLRGNRIHGGLDFAGVGPDAGLGTPIYSIGRARVVLIGRPQENPREFGRPLRRRGTVIRGGRRLPASADIGGYGWVYFFTRSRGRWHAGATVITELLDGPLAGYRVRYMHLGAIHPELQLGEVLDCGQEFALMGGTAVQESIPHLHIDCETPEGDRIDLTPYLDFESAAETLEELEGDEIPGCKK